METRSTRLWVVALVSAVVFALFGWWITAKMNAVVISTNTEGSASSTPLSGETANSVVAGEQAFACDHGKALTRTIALSPEPHATVLLDDGRTISLHDVSGGAGSKYEDDSRRFVLWSEAGRVRLDDAGMTIYANCVLQ